MERKSAVDTVRAVAGWRSIRSRIKSQQTQTLLKNSELLGRGRNVSLPQCGAGDIWRQEASDPVYT